MEKVISLKDLATQMSRSVRTLRSVCRQVGIKPTWSPRGPVYILFESDVTLIKEHMPKKRKERRVKG
jgi:hypothetical protein